MSTGYIKFWFWLDLVATYPFDLLFVEEGGILSFLRFTKASKALKTMRVAKVARAVRLLRLFRMQAMHKDTGRDIYAFHFRNLMEPFSKFELVSRLVFPMQVLATLTVIAHLNGCAYGALRGFEPASGSGRVKKHHG